MSCALIIYLRGPGSARSQAVPCVKTCSSLSAFRCPRERSGLGRVAFTLGFKTPRSALLSVTPVLVSGKNRNTSYTILIVIVREGSTYQQVIQLKLMTWNQTGWLRPLHVCLMCWYQNSLTFRKKIAQTEPPSHPLSFSLSPIPLRRYRTILVNKHWLVDRTNLFSLSSIVLRWKCKETTHVEGIHKRRRHGSGLCASLQPLRSELRKRGSFGFPDS